MQINQGKRRRVVFPEAELVITDMLLLLFFRHLKITLDSEQPMLE